MVNNISDTPFKINQPLLDYLNGAGAKHNLLMDPLIKHKYADLEKRSRYQERMLASYNSKVLLQETIFDIAEFYKRFSKIYFPVRLDQKGRPFNLTLHNQPTVEGKPPRIKIYFFSCFCSRDPILLVLLWLILSGS